MNGNTRNLLTAKLQIAKSAFRREKDGLLKGKLAIKCLGLQAMLKAK